MASSPRKILVAGATGKQGLSLVRALRNSTFQVLALTRDPTGPKAKGLVNEPHVEVVQGDLDNPESIRRIFDAGGKGSIWGVFMVLAFPGLGANADGEERQGIGLSDLALEYEVSVFVFSSVERGSESYDEHLKLDRAALVNIERHVRSLEKKGLHWTILRPAFFMDNFDGTIGRLTATVLRCGLKPDTKLQLVAASDIGPVAAAIFENPEPNYSKIFVVRGDMLSMAEQDAAYFRATGKHLPSVPNFIGRLLISINGATQGLISDIERVYQTVAEDPEGYEAQMEELKAVYPHMTSFEDWARKERDVSKTWSFSWNQVSIRKLLTGRQ